MQNDSVASTFESKSLWLSIGLHVGIFALFTLKANFFPDEPIDIQGAIRVDVLALPEKFLSPPPIKKKLSKPKAKTIPKRKIKKKVKKNTVNLKKRSAKMKEAINRARALQKIEDLLQKEEDVAQPIKGNEISKGNQLNGVKKLQYEDYIGDLERHVRSSWSIPSWLANLDLKASVRVKITPQGFVKFKQIVKSSGNETYDDAVLATVDRSSPFPPPSDKFRTILENEGFVLGFPE